VALGRSRGGLSTKIHAATLDESCSVVLQLSPGEASDSTQFEAIYAELPEDNVLESAALDKGYDANRIRERLVLDGIEPVIPGRSNRREVILYDRIKYAKRNVVERFFNKLKQFRRIATRYEKYAHTFLAMTHIVAAFILVRNS
jgi:transposase